MLRPEDRRAKRSCTRFLSLHAPMSPRERLQQMIACDACDLDADFYGAGGAVEALECRTAALLGKPAALFFIKGMAAQICSLRAYADARGTSNVVIHPLSHMDVDEANAIERAGGLNAIRIGRSGAFHLQAVQNLTEPLAAIVVELPLRRAAYALPALEDLRALSDWCRARAIPLHFDGARLWEAAAGYGIPLADLAALADSVYVSFYKGLGGLGGAILAASRDHVASLEIWKTRHAGNLHTAFPYAISALDGLDIHLPRMESYVRRARGLAARLRANGTLIVNPAIPAANAFQLILPGEPRELTERNRAFAGRSRIWLFNGFAEAALDGHCIAEIAIGDAADDYTDDEAVDWIMRFSSAGPGEIDIGS